MEPRDRLPEHFFIRELLYLPLKAGQDFLVGAGTIQHRDTGNIRTRNYRAPEYSAVLLLRGRGFYEDERGQITPLEKGSFFQRFPGVRHSTFPDREGRWSEFYISLPSSLFSALEETGFLNRAVSVRKTPVDEELIDTIIEIKDFFRRKDQLEAGEILPYIMKYLYLAQRSEEETEAVLGTEEGEDRFLHLLHNRLRSPGSYTVDIGQLCREQGMGYEKFRKRFKANYQISPGVYCVKYRIDEACRRMKNRHMTIKEVAMDLGYPNLSSFSRQFTRVKGLSPRQWLDQPTGEEY